MGDRRKIEGGLILEGDARHGSPSERRQVERRVLLYPMTRLQGEAVILLLIGILLVEMALLVLEVAT